VAEIIFGKPYKDVGLIRDFDVSRDDAEYVWHKDPENREIEVLEGEGWQFQYEGALPWCIHPGMIFEIRGKRHMHRLIKGVNNLKVRIIKHG
tara:strand:+ start:932 stop:1207 length:276 start_codon:yes stop_codon:yes gene_type:complete